MNLKLNVLKKFIATISAAVMVASLAVPVCAGKNGLTANKAKNAKLANKELPKEVDESITRKNAVDNISKKIDELGLKLADAIAQYYKTKKDFESQTKCKDEKENDSICCAEDESVDCLSYEKSDKVLNDLIEKKLGKEFLRNLEYKRSEEAFVLKIYEENLKKLEEKIIKLKDEYIAKYEDLRQEFKILKANELKYTNQPTAKSVIENQINILQNKINSISTTIYGMNINFSMCGLYDCLIKSNVNGIISDLSYKNSNGFNGCAAAINSINLKLEQAVSNNLTGNDFENLLSYLNVLNDSFDSLDPNEKIQISLDFLKTQKLLNALDKNLNISKNNNIMHAILDKAKKTISNHIYEFLKFNSMNYMDNEDINNYLPELINNEYIYNSRNINELDQRIFDIFKLTNKNLMNHKCSELVNLPENSEQLQKDACRLILSDLKISIMNILGKLDNILNSSQNPQQNMTEILEKVVKNIKLFNKTFNNDQSKDKFDLLCGFLTKTNSNIQNIQSELQNYMNNMCDKELKNYMNIASDQERICGMINSIQFELNKILTQEVDNIFK